MIGEKIKSAIKNYIKSKGGHYRCCNGCGQDFVIFKKEDILSCQTCKQNEVKFSQNSQIFFWEQIWRKIESKFDSKAFVRGKPSSIALDGRGGTKFIGAGLQILEPNIYEHVKITDSPIFVAQPVVRLNYWNKSNEPGFSTSFINICTEQVKSSIGSHLYHLDHWFKVLSSLPFSMSMLEIKLPKDVWTGGGFSGQQIIFSVNGIEIGDAIFITKANKEAKHLLPITDFSFGLERIVGATNRSIDFLPFVGPLPEATFPNSAVILDRLKSAVLLTVSGIQPSSRNHGRVLRKILYDAVVQGATSLNLSEVLFYFDSYWRTFLPLSNMCPQSFVIKEILQEMRRSGGISLSKLAKCSSDKIPKSSTDLCRKLLLNGLSTEDISLIGK
jgi:hypothetical protein